MINKLFIFLFFWSQILMAQEDYKYVIVKSKFDFVKSIDGYSTSSLTKFLFNKHGFTAFLDNEELPSSIANNRCNALFAEIKDNSGFLLTKSTIELRDCRGKLLLISKVGTSRVKSYKRAYYESISNAFKTIESFKIAKKPEKSKVIIKEVEEKPKSKPITEKPKAEVAKKEATVLEELSAFNVGKEIFLFDSDKNLKFKLIPTKSKNKFLIKDKKGTLFNNGYFWIATYNKGKEKVTERFKIKF